MIGWCNMRRMRLNVQKSHVMWFHVGKRKLKSSHPQICLGLITLATLGRAFKASTKPFCLVIVPSALVRPYHRLLSLCGVAPIFRIDSVSFLMCHVPSILLLWQGILLEPPIGRLTDYYTRIKNFFSHLERCRLSFTQTFFYHKLPSGGIPCHRASRAMCDFMTLKTT